ncbi:hypothetical protein M2158_009963 [Streptomyces sp. SAI-144]|uniref:hypothetical protein n=1 Tax=Streptomyces sp. SAI-144 TaxID=2940544 RepID=UPI0024757842|nr:hypothetical protein [Streptomyces sp. SAI-144]MDH6441422.1 hypothetical protein [Streptomyces sp. SAI-144]
MTPWLRATVLAILVGSCTVVLPQGGRPYGTPQAYGAELRPLSSAGPTDSGRPRGAASPSPSLTDSRSPGWLPAHQPLRRTDWSLATGTPPRTAPSSSASPSDTPSSAVAAHGRRHPATSPAPSSPADPSDSRRGHGPERASPSASLAPSPSAATPSRAGSRAGEGRERPGRREEPAEEEDADADGTDSGGTDSGETDAGDGDLTTVSEPPQRTAVAPSRPAQQPAAAPKVFILPLGTGLVLVGLGLALGLFALRVRRG